MNNKAVKIFLSVILAVVLIFGVVAVVQSVRNGDAPEAVSAAATEGASTEAPETETQAPKTVTLQFLSVGDNLIHDGIYEQAQKRAGGSGYDFSFCYERVKDTVQKADIATINQETIIAKSYKPSGYPLFNSPTELGDEVVKTGFDVVSMANNHMLDKTTKGLQEAIDFWDSKEGVAHTGAYKDEADLETVEYIEKDGIKIGLVGVTQYTNGLSLPKDSPMKILYTTDTAAIEKKIKAAAASCDMVLVNAHWGSEYTTTPSQDQRNLAAKMAEWGADVIIGHHPHVLQPVEWIDNADGGACHRRHAPLFRHGGQVVRRGHGERREIRTDCHTLCFRFARCSDLSAFAIQRYARQKTGKPYQTVGFQHFLYSGFCQRRNPRRIFRPVNKFDYKKENLCS